MAHAYLSKRIRKVLVAAGAGQLVVDLDTLMPSLKGEVKFVQVTADVACTVDLYWANAETAATDSGDIASFGPGHVPAGGGANLQWLGHGPQNPSAKRKLKADVVGAVTNLRIYLELEPYEA